MDEKQETGPQFTPKEKTTLPMPEPIKTIDVDANEVISQKKKGKFGNLGGLMPIIVSVGIVIVAIIVGVPMMAPGVEQYRADITRLELDLVAQRDTDTQIRASLEAQINELKAKITALEQK